MAVTIDGTNGITSPDFEPSSSTTPTNGLFLPTTNTLAWATNSTERLRLDASGNLGLGVTPNTWSLGTALQLGGGASILGYANYTYLSSNAYYNAGWKYIGSGNATYYQQNAGIHAWNTAPSGTAGNAISFTQAMTLDASGNLGIGTSSPNYKLHIGSTSANATNACLASGATDNNFQLWATNGDTGNTIGTIQARFGLYYSGVGEAAALRFLRGNGATDGILSFATSATERMRIDSSGNLLVGTTSASAKVVVYQSSSGVALDVSAATTTAATAVGVFTKALNSTATSNALVQFNINGGAAGSGQINANGANAAAFGTYSDSRLKENITALPSQLASVCALKPSEFDYKDGSGHQVGFIAQEMQEVYPDAVGQGEDGMLTITGWSKTEARLVKAIQELTARLEALENK